MDASSSFVLSPRSSSINTIPSVVFFAKTRSSKQKTNNNSSSSSGGGGFGSAPTNNRNRQIRTVSGFSGSGTKPLRVAANIFDKLQKDFGVDCIHDVYVRSPLHDETLFWFVGKVARCLEGKTGTRSGLVAVVPTPQEAVTSQKRLILEYAKRELRPQNMGGPYYEKALELWLAPGNSEMDVVQNKVTLEKVESTTLRDGFDVSNVGYNPEIYVGDEVTKGGLRVTRDEQGRPMKPVFEINESA